MSDPTVTAAITALRNYLAEVAPSVAHAQDYEPLLETVARAAKPQIGEPVAWRRVYPDGQVSVFVGALPMPGGGRPPEGWEPLVVGPALSGFAGLPVSQATWSQTLPATPASAIAATQPAVEPIPMGEGEPEPLVEPVTVAKAMRAHREAKVWLDNGTGPVCCVALVNIQVTPWNRHTPSEANAFADGFNLAAKWMRSALATRQAAEGAGGGNG